MKSFVYALIAFGIVTASSCSLPKRVSAEYRQKDLPLEQTLQVSSPIAEDTFVISRIIDDFVLYELQRGDTILVVGRETSERGPKIGHYRAKFISEMLRSKVDSSIVIIGYYSILDTPITPRDSAFCRFTDIKVIRKEDWQMERRYPLRSN